MDSNKKFKIAVLFCGHLRTWNYCRDDFVKFMGDADYDIFVHTYTSMKSYHPYIRDTYKVHDNELSKSVSDIESSFGIKCERFVIEDDRDSTNEIREVEKKDLNCYQWDKYEPYHDLQVLKGKGISIRTYLQYRKIRLCNELRKEHERVNNIKYDYVIKLRPDLDFKTITTPVDKILERINDKSDGVVWISPSGCQPSDRIYLCRAEDMDRLIIGLGSANLPTDREYNPHEYLYFSVTQSGMRFDRLMEMLRLEPRIL